MKRLLALLLLLSLTGCAAPPADDTLPALAPVTVEADAALGLAVTGNLHRSMHATESFPGAVRLEGTAAAVVLDGEGVIRRCAIGGVTARREFDSAGALLPGATDFPSKAALGADYGMHKASSLGTEWQQQADDFARSCLGKTAAQLQSADAVTSVTIDTADLLRAVVQAAENAQTVPGLSAAEALTLTCRAAALPCRSADGSGFGRVSLRFSALAQAGDAEQSAALTAHVTFDDAGHLQSDVSAAPMHRSPTLAPSAATEEERRILRQISTEMPGASSPAADFVVS